jgi:hypothetical protein
VPVGTLVLIEGWIQSWGDEAGKQGINIRFINALEKSRSQTAQQEEEDVPF